MTDGDDRTGYLWWKHGVLYQIYPRSFADSDRDGIGDLAGLKSRLDYLRDLGVSGIWLSPIFPSPMKDFGYDISNYLDIDPVFGTLQDLADLIDEAHQRGIRVILDMVFNHSSDRHPWFLESRSSEKSAFRDWYIWHPGRRTGRGGRRPPNNWRAAFGGKAWTWDKDSGAYYLHLFLKEQPDLNWRNPEVRQALLEVLRHWMELGIDGFRFDVINFIAKDAQFRSNPYGLHRALPRRFEQQNHLYDRSRPESHEYLKEVRELLDRYPERMSVGEIFPNEGVIDHDAVAAYQGNGDDELHLTFDFSLNYVKFRARDFREALQGQYAAVPAAGWPAHVLSNHDQSRVMSRLARGNTDRKKLLLTLLLTQRGTPFLYYGDEIGMEDGPVPRRRMKDPVGIRYWPFHPGRDRARTPMQWDDSVFGGFSAVDPWLPVSPTKKNINVVFQNGKYDSVLELTRRLIALRSRRVSLNRGSWELLPSPGDVLAYRRREGEEVSSVFLNFSRRVRKMPLDLNSSGGLTVLSDTLSPVDRPDPLPPGPSVVLGPLQGLVVDG